MRIAQFTSSLLEPLGGAEQYCLALARAQKSAGHDVLVVTGWVDDGVVASLAADGIPTIVLSSARPYPPDRRGPSVRTRLRFHAGELRDSVWRSPATRELEKLGLDALHVHRFAGFGTSILCTRGCRVVHTVHDYTLIDTSASLMRGGRLLVRPSLLQRARAAIVLRRLPTRTTLIFPSDRTRDRHLAWGFPRRRFDQVVLPHGWPTPSPARVSRPREKGLAVLFLGKLSEQKGVTLLLEAWSDGVPGAALRVAGDGPLAADVASNPAVEFLGWLDERARTAELLAADVLVFPSVWPENFPIVVAESMLAGVPVVTTTIASPPLVEDGESGLVVTPTAAELRAAFVSLIADPALLAALKVGTRARAVQLDMTAHTSAVLDAYRVPASREASPRHPAVAS
jgi:glycosyltransferase involved in cell wall biosynthesis